MKRKPKFLLRSVLRDLHQYPDIQRQKIYKILAIFTACSAILILIPCFFILNIWKCDVVAVLEACVVFLTVYLFVDLYRNVFYVRIVPLVEWNGKQTYRDNLAGNFLLSGIKGRVLVSNYQRLLAVADKAGIARLDDFGIKNARHAVEYFSSNDALSTLAQLRLLVMADQTIENNVELEEEIEEIWKIVEDAAKNDQRFCLCLMS